MKNTQVGVAELAASFELRTPFAARSPLERSFRSGETEGDLGEKAANEVIALIEQYRSDIVEPAA
jgi:hypothetical protein